jgi:peptidoglycan-associated lipoprotein
LVTGVTLRRDSTLHATRISHLSLEEPMFGNTRKAARAATGLGVACLLAACATKGALKRAMDDQRTALAGERNERIAGDSANQQQIAAVSKDVEALRTDLQSLRTEFGAKITALETGMQFAFPVNFAFDDATIRSQDTAALDRFAQVAKKYYAGSLITVEGFADPAGSVQYNLALSKRRAESVKQYLVDHGMTTQQVSSVGYGKTRLVVPGAWGTISGAETNRRVVFVIESKGENPVALATPPGQN